MAVIGTGLRHAADSCCLLFRRFRADDGFADGFRCSHGNCFFIAYRHGFDDTDGFDHSHAHFRTDRFAHTDRDDDTDQHADRHAVDHADGIAYAKTDAPAHNEPYGQPGAHGHAHTVIR